MKLESVVETKLGGAREGRPTWLRRIVARATAASLSVFVVPDLEYAQAYGLDLRTVGLSPVANPRQANVLLLVGELPPGLAEAAGFVYAQMLRPRAVFMLGTGGSQTANLPKFDVSEELSQAGLARGVHVLRHLFASGAWAPDVEGYSTSFIDSQTGDKDQHNQTEEDKGEETGKGDSPGPGPGPDPDQEKLKGSAEEQKPPDGHTGKGQDATPGEKATGQDQSHSGMNPNDHSSMKHNTPEPEGRSPAMEMHQHHHSSQSQEAGQGHLSSTEHQDRTGHTSPVHGHQPEKTGHPQKDHNQPVAGGMAMEMEEVEGAPTDSSGPEGNNPSAGHDQMEMAVGMDHSSMDHAVGHTHMNHMNMSGMDHSQMGHKNMSGSDHSSTDHGKMDHGKMDHGKMDHGKMDHSSMGGMDHSSMGHNMDMDMSMGGFMSMVEMTKDLPRSRDELPMEWVEAPFGPLFRGLPGGLLLNFTLDGDVVARAEVKTGSLKRNLAAGWQGPAVSFPEKLARLTPATPLAYQVLAQKALENAAGQTVDEAAGYQRVVLLERERMFNHLGLVARLAYLLGVRQLAASASELQIRLARPLTPALFQESWNKLSKLCRSTPKIPLLKSRLKNVAVLSPQSVKDLGGSVAARVINQAADARSSDPAYLASGFKPIVRAGGDALARFEVYLGELEQSFGLVEAATARLFNDLGQSVDNLFEAEGITGPFAVHPAPENEAVPGPGRVHGDSRPGTATIETPHGPAYLSLTLEAGQVKEVKLETPSKRRLPLVGQVTEGQDLADALVGVVSLNLSPWELDY
ncbi:MAG: hypothetical protein BGO39_17915 [Chloroflexi bacterium 54-19]|nr:MAG: hypothetical protein BGO39_17915 [Chloroflexi bacterium 54-19]